VFGNELCGILKENAEPIKAMSNPISFNPNKALGELHSHLFCPNCIEDYQGQETITKTRCCNIAFHESCLKEHMEMTEHAKCPMCRTTPPEAGTCLANAAVRKKRSNRHLSRRWTSYDRVSLHAPTSIPAGQSELEATERKFCELEASTTGDGEL